MLRASALLLLASIAVTAQTYQPGPQVASFFSTVDDSDQPYGLYLPRSFDANRKYPLVVMLHGAGSNHRLDLRRVFGQGNRPGETDAEASRYFPNMRDVPFIVASTLARGTMGYTGIAERDVYDMLADVRKRFPIDEDRVYLTGLSMGGGGSLQLALTRPDIWAAIAPVCPAPPPGLEPLAGNALAIPFKIFQGAADTVVPPQSTRDWQARLQDAGVKSEYVEYPGVRHNSWDYAYKDGAIFDWLADKKRNRFPQRVHFTSREYRYATAYWVAIDRLTPGTPATIDASITPAGAIQVTTSNVDAFTLKLGGHPLFKKSAAIPITIDGKLLRVKSSDTLSFSRPADGAWLAKADRPSATDKMPGTEGPLRAVLASRHMYVYGTAGAPTEEELTRRRDQAQLAAEWSTPKNRLLLTFKVASDAELREDELRSANLILFGTAETNTAIARLAPKLPLRLNTGAADYGLLYIYGLDGRYIVVNSGLPWWTHVDQLPPPAKFNFLPVRPRVLASFGDLVLYKGGIDNVVAEGLFDAHWKLPPALAAQLAKTDAVEVRR